MPPSRAKGVSPAPAELDPLAKVAVVATARALAIDAVSAQAVLALRTRGVDPILLKGPTTTEWLYAGEARGYVDADLLVAPDQVVEAARGLEQLGFEPVAHHVSSHAHPWVRPADGAEVDLHVSVWGPRAEPRRVWEELWAHSEPATIAGADVRVLGLPARALHIALHAVQHRDNSTKAREDLRRALERAPIEVWRESERLAQRLDALPYLVDGLMLEPLGWKLLSQLPLARQEAKQRHGGASHFRVRLARLARAKGAGAKISVVAEALRRRWPGAGTD
jgi:hypothetical protein